MNRERGELPYDFYSLVDIGVPPPLAERAAGLGEVPKRGPGCHSIPRKMETAAQRKQLERNGGRMPPSGVK
jgi:hypothetical protein